MSNWQPWDYDELHRRRPRVEYMPPEREPRAQHVRVTITRQRSTGPSLMMIVCIVVLAFMLWRLGFMPIIMLAALLGLLPH